MPRILPAAAALALAAMTATAPVASSSPDGDVAVRLSSGTFTPYSADATAITYAADEVPIGSRANLLAIMLPNGDYKLVASLRGLEPNRDYGAHVHVRPCGPTGADAGPHFQQVEAPEGVSGDPTYANPDNEVWLDFHTDAAGNAVTTAFGDWDLRGAAHSFVIHEHRTKTAPGVAGDAGSRLACLDARF